MHRSQQESACLGVDSECQLQRAVGRVPHGELGHESGPEPDQEWFTGRSYLGFWMSPTPRGPWTQIHESTSWTPGGDKAAQCYSPIIAPKWIAPDGKSFWLVWTDYQWKLSKDEEARRRGAIKQLSPAEQPRARAEQLPLLVLMVAYTIFGLWILSLPLAE